ncbi:MAG: hypothetical protein QNJ84_10655 [Alphaproteobacteria bacterium]|nr:hypothetical protein [Alphaproteobacteria bacterium]
MNGDVAESGRLELELKQLAESGSLATIMFQDENNERTALGKRAKERRSNEEAQSAALTRLLLDPVYRAAYAALEDTIRDSRDKLALWNKQIEDRLAEIERKLNDPDNPLSAAERERLEQEQRDLIRWQQELIDTGNFIDDVENNAQNGEYEDPDALKDAQKDIEDRMDRLEKNAPVIAQDAEAAPAVALASDTKLPSLDG